MTPPETPTGWLDIHGHFYPPASPETHRQKWQAMRDGQFLVPESATHWSADRILAYLDRAGVQMQMLSNIPRTLPELRASNEHGAALVKAHPGRFGLMAALPTDDPEACVEEIRRAGADLNADGYAVTCCYNEVYLSDPSLDPVWEELDKRHAVVFTHPNAYASASMGRPVPLIEVAFETARTVVDMLYKGVFRRWRNITWIISHAGGALPALSGRVKLLGAEEWVPNPLGVTKDEIGESLRRLYLDTAATGMPESLGPAVRMVGAARILYGSDCGVPCSTHDTMEENRRAIIEGGVVTGDEVDALGRRGWELFPAAKARVLQAQRGRT